MESYHLDQFYLQKMLIWFRICKSGLYHQILISFSEVKTNGMAISLTNTHLLYEKNTLLTFVDAPFTSSKKAKHRNLLKSILTSIVVQLQLKSWQIYMHYTSINFLLMLLKCLKNISVSHHRSEKCLKRPLMVHHESEPKLSCKKRPSYLSQS